MTARTRLLAVASAAVITCLSARPVSVATQGSTPVYGLTDLGTPPGATASWAVTTSGYSPRVAGYATAASGPRRAFVGSATGLRDLGTLGGASSEAHALTYAVVAGTAQTATGAFHAFVADADGRAPMRDIGTLGGMHSAVLAATYDRVVGVSDTSTPGVRRPFVFDLSTGTLSELPLTLGGPSAAATAIDGNGRIAGHADLPGGGHHAVLFAGGITYDLGSFGGNSEARGLAAGVVVGVAWLDTSARRAFRWSDGVMQDLGTLGGASSEATGVADDGTIVGWAEDAEGRQRAVLWRDGIIVDLNTAVAAPGWTLEAATGVTRLGLISGYGRKDGSTRAFLLGPPVDLRADLVVHVNLLDTNRPNPHASGERVVFGTTVYYPSAGRVAGATLTVTLTGPVEIESWVPTNSAEIACAGEPRQLTCRLAPNSDLGTDLMVYARSTSAGLVTHTASVVGDAPDPQPANNSGSETNMATSLASLILSASTVVGGSPVLGRATLTSRAHPGGSRVPLSSSRPDVASVPFPFDVLPWCCDGIWREFYVTTLPVTEPVAVDISARYGLVTQTVPLTIVPAGWTLAEPVTWTATTNVSAAPGTIRKTGGCDGCFDASALSTQAIGSGGGAVDFTVVDPTALLVAGLSDADGPPTSIDFGISGGDVRENGAYRASAPWRAGDVFRVAVSAGGAIAYARNGQVFYTSNATATGPLRVVGVLATPGAVLSGATVSGDVSTVTGPDPPGTAVSWTQPINVTIAGDRLSKSAGCDGCFDASAVSAQRLDGVGAFTFRVVDPAALLVAGLSDGSGSPTALTFGLSGGDVREQGVYRASAPWLAGDLFRVAVDADGVVTYARNGVVFYTSALEARAPLRAAAVLASAGAAIEEGRLTGAWSEAPSISPVTWRSLVNASADGARLTKTSGCDGCFDAVAVSAETIGGGGGAVQFTVVDPARLLVAGLDDDPDASTGIAFGLSGGDVRENGVYRAEVPIAAGDVLRIAVDAAGAVTYARNGLVFHTSAVRATAALRVVVRMATIGAAVDEVALQAAAPASSAP